MMTGTFAIRPAVWAPRVGKRTQPCSSLKMMGLPNPITGIRKLLGLADWRNVNVGNEERRLFSQTNLGPIMEKSGVDAQQIADDNLIEGGDSISSLNEGISLGLQNLAENSVDNLMKEKQMLEDELQLIWAIEQRNEARIGSFVDEEAQWESMSDEERQVLSRKPFVEECIDALNEALAAHGLSVDGDSNAKVQALATAMVA